MTIYDPKGIYGSTFGKELPSLSNQRFNRPKFGPAGSRFGGVANGLIQVGNHLWKYRQGYTRVASTVIGAVAAGQVLKNETNNKKYKALRATYSVYGGKRYRNRTNRCQCKAVTKREHCRRCNRGK